jgi:hypothetical protein
MITTVIPGQCLKLKGLKGAFRFGLVNTVHPDGNIAIRPLNPVTGKHLHVRCSDINGLSFASDDNEIFIIKGNASIVCPILVLHADTFIEGLFETPCGLLDVFWIEKSHTSGGASAVLEEGVINDFFISDRYRPSTARPQLFDFMTSDPGAFAQAGILRYVEERCRLARGISRGLAEPGNMGSITLGPFVLPPDIVKLILSAVSEVADNDPPKVLAKQRFSPRVVSSDGRIKSKVLFQTPSLQLVAADPYKMCHLFGTFFYVCPLGPFGELNVSAVGQNTRIMLNGPGKRLWELLYHYDMIICLIIIVIIIIIIIIIVTSFVIFYNY